MPVARFQMPDGRIARFEVPDGTTPAQAQSMFDNYVASDPARFENRPHAQSKSSGGSKQRISRQEALALPEKKPQRVSFAEATGQAVPADAHHGRGWFDADGARAAGYTDADIADFLANGRGFDVQGARQAGYTDAEIVRRLQDPRNSAPAAAMPDGSRGHLSAAGDAPDKPPAETMSAMDALWKIQGGIAHELANKVQDLPVVGPLYRGGRELADGLAQGIAHVGEKLGIASPETVAMLDSAAMDSKESYERTKGGAWRKYAPIAGGVATSLPILGFSAPAGLAAKVATGAATGAGYSAAMPVYGDDYWGTKGRQALTGAAVGGVLAPVGAAASKLIAPRLSDAAQRLADAGIPLTPGQIFGGTARRMEEAAKSMPFVGDAIAAAENRGIEQFNRAAISRALFHIGKSLPKAVRPGYGAVEYAGEQIGKAYDDILPHLRLTNDKPFAGEVQRIQAAAQNMGAKGEQFGRILQTEVLDKFTGSTMTGETVKRVEAQLGYYARKFQRSLDPSDQLVFDALRDTQTALRRALERSNPQARSRLKAINRSFAEMLRVERAAGMQGAKEGIFTPNQLQAAVRALDSSGRKRSFARGQALMQDLATDGGLILSPRLNNSGTADRLLLNGLALGGGAYLSPGALAGGLLAAGAYSAPAQRVIGAALTRRPPGAGLMADTVERTLPLLGVQGLLQ